MKTPFKLYPSALAARCAGQNEINALANRLVPLYLAALAPFLGQPIEKATGGLRAKVKEVLDPITPEAQTDGYTTPHAWLSTGSGYSLTLHVKTCKSYARPNGEQGCHYEEVTIYLADLQGITLSRFYPFTPGRTDYYPEQVSQLREVHKVARDAADKARSALHPFGESDR